MRRLLLAPLAAALLLAACKKKPAPPVEAERGPLQEAVEGAGGAAPCASVIPMHFSPSLPVPAAQSGRLFYKIFFYGRDGNPQAGFAFHLPEGWATLAADGRVLDCRLGARARALAKTASPWTSMEQVQKAQNRFYAAAEKIVARYASGLPVDASARPQVAEYAAAFAALVTPGHEQAYRALSPDFWAWVEKNGGKAP